MVNHKGKISSDCCDFPPCDCPFKKGDVVDYVNDNGVRFLNKVINGFTPVVCDRFIYLDLDSWWYPVKQENIKVPKNKKIKRRNIMKTPLQVLGSFSTVRICDADGKTLATMNKSLGEKDYNTVLLIVTIVNQYFARK